jgi:HlyD family secretion protein
MSKIRVDFRRLVLAMVLATSLAATGCQHSAATAPSDADAVALVQVTSGKPERKTLTLSTTQPCQIEAFEQTPLFSKLAGYVEEVLVDIGDKVQKGQTLIKLSVPELHDELAQKQAFVAQADAEVKQAESTVQAMAAAANTAEAKIAEAEAGIARATGEYDRSKSEHARIKELAAKGSVTKKLEEETLSELQSAEAATREVAAKAQSARATYYEAQSNVDKSKADLVAAEARLKVSKADLSRAKTMLGYTEIRAPYDGTVTRRNVDTGHYVTPADSQGTKPLMTVARMDTVRVFVDVPELEAEHVDAGDPVMVHVQALEGQEFDAQVNRTSWSLLESNHSLRAEIDVANPDGHLRPGMYATATIRLVERPNVVVIPMTSVMRNGKETYCWEIDAGKIKHRTIQLGLRSGTNVEVTSGLDENVMVVLKQPESLQEGQHVRTAATP